MDRSRKICQIGADLSAFPERLNLWALKTSSTQIQWWLQWHDNLIIVRPEMVLRGRRNGWSAT
jgi:hypothetical protein